jgi:hypothetical protein
MFDTNDNDGSESVLRNQLVKQHAVNHNLDIELAILCKHIYYRRYGAIEAYDNKQIDGSGLIAEVDVTQVGTVITVTVELLVIKTVTGIAIIVWLAYR